MSDLAPVIDALEAMRDEGIIDKYAVGGAFAAVLHAEPISTVDLDIFFLFKEKQAGPILSLEKIYDFAKRNALSFDHEFINIHGWLVQFVESGNNPLWSESVETATSVTFGVKEIPVIDKEHLVASWLLAGRAKDYQKIAMFISAGIVDHSRLMGILEKHGLAEKWESERWRFEDE